MPSPHNESDKGAVIYLRVSCELHSNFYARLAIENRSASDAGAEMVEWYLSTPVRPRQQRRKAR